MLIPLGVVGVLLVLTVVAHAVQQPDVSDPDFLNPASDAPIGAADLAARVRAAGATVRTVTNSADALLLGGRGDTTVFVPAPQLVTSDNLNGLRLLPDTTVVVLVMPDSGVLDDAVPAVRITGQRWATHTAAPGCELPAARAAGPAGLDRVHYAGDGVHDDVRCYAGGLVEVDAGPRIVVVGATDPFRNDRIGETGNAALATTLLTGTPTVVWLDLHKVETEPKPDITVPPPPRTTTAPPEVPPSGEPSGIDPGDGDGSQGGDQRTGLAALFPGWLWTVIGLLALVGLLLALAASRRLGPPVTEPMPVTARARESLEGRGRLYKQARQPAAALGVLRASALAHLPGLLGLPPNTPVPTLIDAVAAQTGYPPGTVQAILVTDTPDNHAELVTAVGRLDDLMWALHAGHPTAEGDTR